MRIQINININQKMTQVRTVTKRFLVKGQKIEKVITRDIEIPENASDLTLMNIARNVREFIQREYYDKYQLQVNVYPMSEKS